LLVTFRRRFQRTFAPAAKAIARIAAATKSTAAQNVVDGELGIVVVSELGDIDETGSAKE
jgi:hypothetical protein